MHVFRQEAILLSALNTKNIVIQKLGHVISAEAVSARTSSAPRNVSGDQEEEEVTEVPQPIQGSYTPEGAKIHTRAQDTTPEMEPPLQKKAKRGGADEEQEEGEIVDSSDEEGGNSSGVQCLSKDPSGDA